MKRILLIAMLFFLSGCDDRTTLDSAKGLALSAYETGYTQGYYDGLTGNYRPLERAAEIRKLLGMDE